jgi:electron transfer flavoprotein alpha subunit
MEYSGVWILAEQQSGRVQRISYELLTCGLELAGKRNCRLSAVIFGHNINTNDLEELTERGADEVIAVEAAELEHFLVEPYSACMLKLIKQRRPEIIIAGATSTGRTLMPYVAAKAHLGLTADCTELDIEKETNNLLQTRPAIGGNIMAIIKTPKFRPQMSTVRPRSTKPAPRQQARSGEIIRLAASKEELNSRIARMGFTANEEKRPLGEADTVVVVGRGIKKAENIPIVRELADSLGAALGATRDVVDRGWLSYPHQVGLSGQTISPKLYIGIGVSGSIQHLAGMQTAETIVAVNNDSDAPIFKVADFGIMGDLFEVVPVLTAHIRQEKNREK